MSELMLRRSAFLRIIAESHDAADSAQKRLALGVVSREPLIAAIVLRLAENTSFVADSDYCW